MLWLQVHSIAEVFKPPERSEKHMNKMSFIFKWLKKSWAASVFAAVALGGQADRLGVSGGHFNTEILW